MTSVWDELSKIKNLQQTEEQTNILKLKEPYVQQEAQADVRYKNTLSDYQQSLTDKNNAMLPLDTAMKKLDVQEKGAQLAEWMKQAPTRMALDKIKQVYGNQMLDIYDKDPKRFYNLMSAATRLQSAQADAGVMANESRSTYAANEEAMNIYKSSGTKRLEQLRPQINAKYHDMLGYDVLPPGPIDANYMNKVGVSRKSALNTLDFVQKMSLEEVKANAVAAGTQFRAASEIRSYQKQATQSIGAAIGNMFQYDVDTNGNPKFNDPTTVESKTEGHLQNDVIKLSTMLYKSSLSPDVTQDVVSEVQQNFSKKSFDIGDFTMNIDAVAPSDSDPKQIMANVNSIIEQQKAKAEANGKPYNGDVKQVLTQYLQILNSKQLAKIYKNITESAALSQGN